MNLGGSNQRFGIYWLAFGYTLALHVLDEAGHDFLSVYNPNALAIRRVLPFLPVPVFTFRQWIGSLACGLAVWLALAPLAFRGPKWLRRLAIPVAILVGIGNALGHILSSIYLRRLMPGVYSAPLILLMGIVLLRSALGMERVVAADVA
ncbi:MAG: hypothetical protein LAO30_01890 [Acidobacteriia bacterium]|nr:hypothetical protein [Terriglobia bacterium]